MHIPENLADLTREMLRQRPASIELKEIAKKIRVKPTWLTSFQLGRGKDAGSKKVIKLYNYLNSIR